MRKEKTSKIKKLTTRIKTLSREDLLERWLKIIEAFSADDLKNPVIKKSVKIVLENIDKELAEKK